MGTAASTKNSLFLKLTSIFFLMIVIIWLEKFKNKILRFLERKMFLNLDFLNETCDCLVVLIACNGITNKITYADLKIFISFNLTPNVLWYIIFLHLYY